MFQRSRTERLDLNKLIQEKAKFSAKAKQNKDLEGVNVEQAKHDNQAAKKNSTTDPEKEQKAEIE